MRTGLQINLALVFLSVCQSPAQSQEPERSISFARGGRENQGRLTGSLPKSPRKLWSLKIGESHSGAPALTSSRLVIGSSTGEVLALNPRSGERIWTAKTEGSVEASPLIYDKKVFLGSTDGRMAAFDLDSGKELWRFQAEAKIVGGANIISLPAPAESPERLVFGAHDNRVYALDINTGKQLWVFETGNFVNGTPAVSNRNEVVVGGCDGSVYVIDGLSGKLNAQIEIGDHLATGLALDGRVAYFGHYGNKVIALDLDSKKILWTYSRAGFPYMSSAAVTDSLVLIGGRDRRMHAIHRADGKPAWNFRSRGHFDSSPLVIGSEVIFGGSDGRVTILSLDKGEQRWSEDLGCEILAPVNVFNGIIYIATRDGWLYAFGEP